jgi:hypothetical protein
MIMLYARNREWELGDVAVEVNYDPDTTPREVLVTVHLPDGLTADQTTRLERVARTCPVRRALEAGFAFEERILTDTPPAALTLAGDGAIRGSG